MNREIDPFVQERLVELPREVALPLDRRARRREPVPGRFDHNELDLRDAAKGLGNEPGLSQRERAAASAQLQLHDLIFRGALLIGSRALRAVGAAIGPPASFRLPPGAGGASPSPTAR